MLDVKPDPVTPVPGNPSEAPAVAAGALVTLHYRLALLEDGAEREIFSTFSARPATLQIGAGQLPPALEACLDGLAEGASASFDLAPGAAFGHRNPDLVRALSPSALDAAADADDEIGPGDVVEVNAPDGRRVAGVIKQRDGERIVCDFNHPLAGQPLRFAVHVIGVL